MKRYRFLFYKTPDAVEAAEMLEETVTGVDDVPAWLWRAMASYAAVHGYKRIDVVELKGDTDGVQRSGGTDS